MTAQGGRTGLQEGEAAGEAPVQGLVGAQVGEAGEAGGQAGHGLAASFGEKPFHCLRDLVVPAVEQAGLEKRRKSAEETELRLRCFMTSETYFEIAYSKYMCR